jgi:hypothetical protein
MHSLIGGDQKYDLRQNVYNVADFLLLVFLILMGNQPKVLCDLFHI